MKPMEEQELFGHPKRIIFYLFFADIMGSVLVFTELRALFTLYMVNVVFDALTTSEIFASCCGIRILWFFGIQLRPLLGVEFRIRF